MSKNFLNLKQKILVGIFAKALLLGLSSGLLVGSVIALVQRLTLGKVEYLLCILASLGVMLLAGSILILVNFPTDKRIARKIDEGLSLNEKVQTMVAFSKENGAIVQMQRDSTEDILSKVSLKSLVKKTFWLNFVVPILAIAMLITTIAIPPKQILPPEPDGPIEPIDPNFDLTKIQIQELEDLIDYVRDSNMEEAPRQVIVTELEGLLSYLREAEEIKVSEMKQKVLAVINITRKTLDDANSSDDISFELYGKENEYMSELAMSIKDLNNVTLDITLDVIQGTLPSTITKDELKTSCATYSSIIKAALVASNVNETDILFVSLLQFANKLEDIAAKVESTSMNDIQTELVVTFENVKIDIRTALGIQLNNKEVAETVEDELIDIFDISLNEIPAYEDEDYFEPVDAPSDDKPPEEGDGGGYGEGEMLYGSNDKIYDPITGNFVEYGTLIDAYLAKVTEQVQDGKLPPELEDFINDYFATLYGGAKTE